MKSIDHIRGTGVPSALLKALAACTLALSLAACEGLDEKPSHSAGWTLLEPSHRHPILVQQQPHAMSLRVARGQTGLEPGQRAQLYNFLEKYRANDSGNSKLVVSVPAGSSNEVASMHAVADIRPLLLERGFAENAVSIEPYTAEGDNQPPIRVSYLRYHAEGPECGRWPENLGESRRVNGYHNLGCSQQRNMAAQIANPADLLGPRTMTPGHAGRRDIVINEKYTKGEITHSDRSSDERVRKQQRF
jgi:pilus assembly protein CpaD